MKKKTLFKLIDSTIKLVKQTVKKIIQKTLFKLINSTIKLVKQIVKKNYSNYYFLLF